MMLFLSSKNISRSLQSGHTFNPSVTFLEVCLTELSISKETEFNSGVSGIEAVELAKSHIEGKALRSQGREY